MAIERRETRHSGTRYCFPLGADGQLSVDIVAKFIQSRQRGPQTEYRGTTLVAAADGSGVTS